jgi:hypothetical protein
MKKSALAGDTGVVAPTRSSEAAPRGRNTRRVLSAGQTQAFLADLARARELWRRYPSLILSRQLPQTLRGSEMCCSAKPDSKAGERLLVRAKVLRPAKRIELDAKQQRRSVRMLRNAMKERTTGFGQFWKAWRDTLPQMLGLLEEDVLARVVGTGAMIAAEEALHTPCENFVRSQYGSRSRKAKVSKCNAQSTGSPG